MDRRITFVALACATSAALAANTVNPKFYWDYSVEPDDPSRVITGSPEETSGYWYTYNDEDQGGTSKVTFPPDIETCTYCSNLDALVEEFGGIKATVNLGEGAEYPYVGFGFNVWNEEQDGADISAWGGICLQYYSELNFSVELAVENDGTVTEYNNYKARVAKAGYSNYVDLSWDKFRQDTGWGKEVARDSVLAKTAAIKLKFQGNAGTTGDFFLSKIGSLGMCAPCCGPENVVKPEADSRVNVSLSGRTVNFVGVAASAKVTVMDLQGQVMKSTTATGAMDLSALPAGIYMLRVQGLGVNHMQKIILK